MSDRTVEQMHEAAIKRCQEVAMEEGDYSFEVTRTELLALQMVPSRSNIGTAMCRNITGRPERFCGLIIKVKDDVVQENPSRPR